MTKMTAGRFRGPMRPDVLRALAFCALLLTLAFAALPGTAQVVGADDQSAKLEQWDKAADAAQETIVSEDTTNAQLETLREQISSYRSEFAKTRDANAARIATLEAQLKALGPAPEEGKTEPDDVAKLRDDLNDQLSELKAPQVIAEEAYLRANGLVTEIDQILRARQTDQLLTRDPVPLWPSYWPEAATDIKDTVVLLAAEIRAEIASPGNRAAAWRDLPEIAFLIILGLVLLIRGVRLSKRFGAYVLDRGGRGAPVWSFLITLLMIVVPFLGLLAIVKGVELTGFYGPRGRILLDAVPLWGGILLAYHWLGLQLTGLAHDQGSQLVDVPRRSELRVLIDLLALMLVLEQATDIFEQIANVSDASRSVTSFPQIVITALLVLRILQLGVLQRRAPAEDTAETDQAPATGFDTWLPAIRRIVTILAVISPVLAAIGYVAAAEAIVYPLVLTLSLVGAILILHRFFGNIFALIARRDDGGMDSLFSVVVGFILTLVALPVLALIWGARVVDLTELWTRFLQGYSVGGVVISPTSFLVFVIVFAVGLMTTRLIQGVMRNSVLPTTRIDPGGQAAMVSGLGYVGIFLAALIAITSAGINLSSLAIVAGALSVGIGFGLQTIVSNFVSGIILLIERPISKGDWIAVGGNMGYVRDISVRSTRIETFDRTDVILPNSDLISGTVINYTRGNTVGRVIVPVGVAYGTDTRRVEKILLEIANSHPMVLAGPTINFAGFGASSLDFEIRAILRDVNWMLNVKTEMNHMIAERFAKEGIEIPFAQQDLWLRNPEVLPGAHAFHGTSRHNFAAEPGTEKDPDEAPKPQPEIEPDTDGDGDGR